jgi:hypothetical protein
VESQSLINFAFGAILTLAGWVLRTVWDAVNGLKKDLQDLERHLPDTYVRRDDYKDDMTEVKEILHKIFDRLENKADK